MSTWIPINLPKEMVEEIKAYNKNNKEKGFTSVPEFIRSAIRDKFEKIANELKNEK